MDWSNNIVSYTLQKKRAQLKAGIFTASYSGLRIVENIKEVCRALGMDDSERRIYVYSTLDRISKTLTKDTNSKKSPFRRVFSGTAFNYETRSQIPQEHRNGGTSYRC
jgi:hypothetical protein